jgi:hypothetical protein
MTSGFNLSFGPFETGRDVAGILESNRMGDCLLATINEVVRPKLMGTIFRRRAERHIMRVAMLGVEEWEIYEASSQFKVQ